MLSTLFLNADATPINIVPLSIKSWQDAIGSLWLGQSEALHYYDDWVVRSPSVKMKVPAVCILKDQVTLRRNFKQEHGGPTAKYVFLRDGYKCQYCGEVFSERELTLDHVKPKSKGGKSTWNNLCCCCSSCNLKRGNDESIRPKSMPYRPTYQQLVKASMKMPLYIPHISWSYYLNWTPKLMKIVEPQTD